MKKCIILTGITTALVVGVLLGLNHFTNKDNFRGELRAQLKGFCLEEPGCLSALDAHFEGCYNTHYSPDHRKGRGVLNQKEFVKCFNEKSGSDLFGISE